MSKQPKPVRVTIEGVAVVDDDSWLLITTSKPNRCEVAIDDPNVTVEWLPEPRTWTDGDVIQSPTHSTYCRDRGKWFYGGIVANLNDDDASEVVHRSEYPWRVLRYQAADS